MQQVYAYAPRDPGNSSIISPSNSFSSRGMVPNFGNLQYTFVEDPMAELLNCSGVLIRQQPEFFELFTGCETENRYHVFGNSNGYYKYLFKCQENSSCASRFFCPSKIREFNMDIFHVVSTAYTGNISGVFANMFKPCKISCFCLNRPEFIINLGTNNNYVGKIIHTFTCCDPEFEVYNDKGLKYLVRADCCQCGLLCANNICGKLSSATFEIYSAATSKVLSLITRLPAQNFGEMATDADSYEVLFPKKAKAKDKLLLIALGLMIDYQYFETKADDNGRRRRGYSYW